VVRPALRTSTWNVPIDVLISTRGASMTLEGQVPAREPQRRYLNVGRARKQRWRPAAS
jgi:hypothetical protein